jgi:hypothetical protein
MKRVKVLLTTILLILTVILTILILLPQKMSAATVELGAIGYYKGIPACYCGDGQDCACIREDL